MCIFLRDISMCLLMGALKGDKLWKKIEMLEQEVRHTDTHYRMLTFFWEKKCAKEEILSTSSS